MCDSLIRRRLHNIGLCVTHVAEIDNAQTHKTYNIDYNISTDIKTAFYTILQRMLEIRDLPVFLNIVINIYRGITVKFKLYAHRFRQKLHKYRIIVE